MFGTQDQNVRSATDVDPGDADATVDPDDPVVVAVDDAAELEPQAAATSEAAEAAAMNARRCLSSFVGAI